MAFPDDSNGANEQAEELFDEFGLIPDAAVSLDSVHQLEGPHPAEARVAELEKELKEVRDWATRVAADFENYKKRVERERQDQIRFSNERLLKEILPIVDNLQRALDAAARSGEAPSISAGVELVIAETQKILRRAGVEPIAALNQPFDPAIHEALQRVETEAVEAGCVVNEVQPGYTLNGRVLRPALVTVAMPPEVTSPGMDRSDLD
jgi:molecular chaperone GrpE